MEFVNFNCIPENGVMKNILQLHQTIFNDSETLLNRLENKKNLLITLAMENEKVVGYKIGYELDHDKFYSWLGGVDASHRKHGIASNLMKLQHEFLKQNSYKIVQTKTKNKWKNMLILNLKHGFDVIGTYTDEKGEPKIILEKRL